MVHPAATQRLPEWLGDVLLTLDLCEGRRAVAAVEGQRSVRNPRPGSVRIARPAGRFGDVACHDLIRAEKGRDPSHTRQSPRTLAAFRPWGSWQDKRRARGLPPSLASSKDSLCGYGLGGVTPQIMTVGCRPGRMARPRPHLVLA